MFDLVGVAYGGFHLACKPCVFDCLTFCSPQRMMIKLNLSLFHRCFVALKPLGCFSTLAGVLERSLATRPFCTTTYPGDFVLASLEQRFVLGLQGHNLGKGDAFNGFTCMECCLYVAT